MSRRASVFARLNPGKRRVRFPDEVVFEDHIRESDGDAIMNMLRRASVEIDLDRINMSGMTALHQAVLDDNLVMVRLLTQHGAKINKKDEDGWTPLHAAAANGLPHIARYLISQGADKDALTEEEEKAVDLADPEDYKTISVLLNTQESLEKERRVSAVPGLPKREPAWFRRESMQRDPGTLGDTAALLKAKLCGEERKIGVRLSAAKHNDKDSFASLRARKGSLWVGSEARDVVQEEEEEEERPPSPTPPPAPAPAPCPTKSIIKLEKIREKFEVMKTSPVSPAARSPHLHPRHTASLASKPPASTSASASSSHPDMETEESVTSKLEQWKRRRIERLER